MNNAEHAEQIAEFVRLLYIGILGREPDESGQARKVSAILSEKKSYLDIVKEFVEGAEYQNVLGKRREADVPDLCRNTSFPDEEVFPSKETVDRLFKKVSSYWGETVASPESIYWSVLTSKEWKGTLTDEKRSEFIALGRSYADRILSEYGELTGRIETADLTCMDIGAGVGRLAINFADRVKRVIAVDYSAPHLRELERNAELFSVSDKITPHLLRTPFDLEDAPEVDFVYSIISLQHSPPPIIAYTMSESLKHLKEGGVAFLHVPLAAVNYPPFSSQKYLNDSEAGKNMEIHIMPKANLYKIAEMNGCEIVGSKCVGGNNKAYSEEIVFRKRA